MFTNEKNIENFLVYCRCTKNLSQKTLTSYRSDLLLFNAWEKSESGDLLSYISYLINANHKTATIKRRLSSLSQYFKYANRADKFSNPMIELEIKFKSEKTLPKTVSIYEMKKLFGCLESKSLASCSPFQEFQNKRDYALLDLIASTGIRIGEASAIILADIDLRLRTVLIHGKGRKERLIYLSCRDTIENIKRWLLIRKSLNPTDEHLFLNRNRRQMSIHAIENVFRKYRNLAEINPKATPHFLRHTFATNLLANGSDIRSVQEILGHSSIAITERYTEVTQTQKIKIMRKYNYRNNLL